MPDKPRIIGEELYYAIMGPERIKRHKAILKRMNDMGLSPAEKVAMFSKALQATGLMQITEQLEHLEGQLEELENSNDTPVR